MTANYLKVCLVAICTQLHCTSLLLADDDSAKPNVIVIVGDDMGYADIGVHGCKDIPTPHLDELAAGGVRCTNGYVSGPYCSPTRAGLLTGRYQTRFGHEFNPGGVDRPRRRQQEQQKAATKRPRQSGLPLSETTIADRLKEAGYVTGLVGKWHLGNAKKFHPERRGFDEFFGFIGGAHPYLPSEKSVILRGREPVDEREYLTDAMAREAVAFVDRHAAKPFFLYLAFNAVHTPMQADDARLEKFKHIGDEKRRTYAAMMSAMDDAVGQLLGALREKHIEENTLVFFISDNGGPTLWTTSVNGSSNKPLRGSKRTTLEGGIRVPFFVKWPARLPAGKIYDEPVIQLDILPTALASAGSEIPRDAKIEGVDLLPYLNGEKTDPPHDALYWRLGDQMAIRQGDWKLVRYDPRADGQRGAAGEPKLYHLKDDIGETKNLFDDEPDRAAALQAAWDKWNSSNKPPRWGDGSGGRRRNAPNRKNAPQQAG
jgi:arylsulfatase A-like enzyme